MLAGVAPMRRWHRHFQITLRQCSLHLGNGHPHQPRVAIGAITFISDPIGAQVALFEGVNRDAPCACNFNRMGVNGAGVAIKHDIGDGVVLKQGRKARRPCL